MERSREGIAAWRARILDSILLWLAVLAVIPMAITVRAQVVGERFVPIGIVILSMYAVLVAFALWRRGPYGVRAWVSADTSSSRST